MNRTAFSSRLRIGIVVAAAGAVLAGCRPESPSMPADAKTETAPVEWMGLEGVERAPGLRTVHQFSSHNREGLNGDSRWHLFRDERGDAVIMDVIGPGCVRSIWSTDIREGADFRFYFDGESEPRFVIPMLDFFQGAHDLFPPPLVSYERRGYYGERPYAGNCFVPIPFSKGLRISISGPFEFYHILFDRYPHGSRVTTFSGREDRSGLLRAFSDPDQPAGPPPGGEILEYRTADLAPDSEEIAFRIQGPGRIRRLTLDMAADEDLIGDLDIWMRWDGRTYRDVQAPVGFFFGIPVRPRDLRTLPLRVDWDREGRARMICRFPMPFREGAEIGIRNRSSRASGPLRMAAVRGDLDGEGRDFGYFTTRYRRGETVYSRDWPLFVGAGAGCFLGAVQTMQGEHYCEGDERISLDGAVSPQINGTGSEDYYLSCFWPNRHYDSPFASHVGDVRTHGEITGRGDYGVPGCYSRFHLEAPVPFLLHLDARIQHGGLSHIRSNYASLAYAYLRPEAGLVETDFLDVAGAAGEKAHAYRAPGSERTGEVSGHPEGGGWRSMIRESGRRHAGGEIRFRVAVRPLNRGVRLRRRLDQSAGRQAADVFIDGERVGVWYHPDTNPHLCWYDSDFDIHPRFTAGKDRLNVKLAVREGEGWEAYTDFWYRVFILKE